MGLFILCALTGVSGKHIQASVSDEYKSFKEPEINGYREISEKALEND